MPQKNPQINFNGKKHGNKHNVIETYWNKFALSVSGNIELEGDDGRARAKYLWVTDRVIVKFIRNGLIENKNSNIQWI